MTGRLVTLASECIKHRSGYCYTTVAPGLGVSDGVGKPAASLLRLFEDGRELGPGHAIHADVEAIGKGLFSHWEDVLYFSSSDGSSCHSNGRLYQALCEQDARSPDDFPLSSLPMEVLLKLQQGIMSYKYRGLDCFKCPFDLALYQKLFWEVKPRTIIELGTWRGGSAQWIADVLSAYRLDCHVHSFDITNPPDLVDNRITFYKGDALKLGDCMPVTWLGELPRPMIVIDDAGHSYRMTRAILQHFAPVMVEGEYIIIEDAIIHEMAAASQYDGGPRRALKEFLHGNRDFEIDYAYCNFFGENVTWNVNGYLRRR